MFPLNKVPPTLVTLMSKFSNTKKIRGLIHAQLIAGAKSAFSLVLLRHPSANLMVIANADGDVGYLFPEAEIPATIVVERHEDSSKAVEEAEVPKEKS
jgi:hypothetical protein